MKWAGAGTCARARTPTGNPRGYPQSVPETRPLEEQDESKASDFVLELSTLYTGVVVWKSPVTLTDSEGLIYCSRHQTRGGAREMGKWEAGVILPRAASGHAYLGVHEFSACS